MTRYQTLASLTILLLMSPTIGLAQERNLGWLSEEFEVARGGPGTISSGKYKVKDAATGQEKEVEDKGGKSYGSFQMASKRGIDGSSVAAFVKAYYAEQFRVPRPGLTGQYDDLVPGTDAFGKRWKEVVKREGDLFLNNEHEFIYETHFAPVAEEVKKVTGLNVLARSDALKNVLWSVAVQHGPPVDPKGHAANLIQLALVKWSRKDLEIASATTSPPSVSDKAIINAIYDECTRKDSNGKSVYFHDLDLSKRFKQERSDAISAEAREARARAETAAPSLKDTKLGQFAINNGFAIPEPRKKAKELFVVRGQMTFDFSGYDTEYKHTRTPSVPNDRSGLRMGRGYDIGRLEKEQIRADLRAAGFSEGQVEVFSGAAALKGDKAREYIAKNRNEVYAKAKELGLKGAAAAAFEQEHTPKIITLAQQQKLFELSFARAEKDARELFPEYDKLPKGVQAAVADLVYDVGVAGLITNHSGLVKAVVNQDWKTASADSKRSGAGITRNQKIRELFAAAAQTDR